MSQKAESTRPHKSYQPGRAGWIDLDGLRDLINLEAVTIALLGPAPGRHGQRGGRLLWWHCPFHEDANPSFCVTPLKRIWRCFGCGASGDAVGLVMRLKSCAFLEAVRWLEQSAGTAVVPAKRETTFRAAAERRQDLPTATKPGAAAPSRMLDLASARHLVEAAARRLWAPPGKEALGELYRRGLTDATIEHARLGFVPVVDALVDRPGGIVIPWFECDKLVVVKLRQRAGRRPKYRELFRDGPRLFPGPETIRPDCPLVVVEGEFDALLLGQALKDLAAVVTLGSASSRLDRSIADLMLASPAWYLATDADAAGDQAAANWPARAKRVVPPAPSKDWTEAHQKGIDLRHFWWEQLGMECDYEREERAAIMEYDGGLTRTAAECAAGLR